MSKIYYTYEDLKDKIVYFKFEYNEEFNYLCFEDKIPCNLKSLIEWSKIYKDLEKEYKTLEDKYKLLEENNKKLKEKNKLLNDKLKPFTNNQKPIKTKLRFLIHSKLREGKSNRQIAKELNIDEKTVRKYKEKEKNI